MDFANSDDFSVFTIPRLVEGVQVISILPREAIQNSIRWDVQSTEK